MIVSPTNEQEWMALANFLHAHAHVNFSRDLRMIGWVTEDRVRMVVGFTDWLGKTCQMHVAMEPGFTYTPREMLAECFDYAFNTAGREMVLGVVNSKNERAMRYDLALGFKVLHALAKMHDDDGDLVLLGMKKEECKWLQKAPEAEKEPA